jgi:hypothetical protein
VAGHRKRALLTIVLLKCEAELAEARKELDSSSSEINRIRDEFERGYLFTSPHIIN